MMSSLLCSWIQDPPFMETCSGKQLPDIQIYKIIVYRIPFDNTRWLWPWNGEEKLHTKLCQGHFLSV